MGELIAGSGDEEEPVQLRSGTWTGAQNTRLPLQCGAGTRGVRPLERSHTACHSGSGVGGVAKISLCSGGLFRGPGRCGGVGGLRNQSNTAVTEPLMWGLWCVCPPTICTCGRGDFLFCCVNLGTQIVLRIKQFLNKRSTRFQSRSESVWARVGPGRHPRLEWHVVRERANVYATGQGRWTRQGTSANPSSCSNGCTRSRRRCNNPRRGVREREGNQWPQSPVATSVKEIRDSCLRVMSIL